jgi:hypothetical protein
VLKFALSNRSEKRWSIRGRSRNVWRRKREKNFVIRKKKLRKHAVKTLAISYKKLPSRVQNARLLLK